MTEAEKKAKRKAYNKWYREQHKEKEKERHKKWVEAHKAEWNEYQKRYQRCYKSKKLDEKKEAAQIEQSKSVVNMVHRDNPHKDRQRREISEMIMPTLPDEKLEKQMNLDKWPGYEDDFKLKKQNPVTVTICKIPPEMEKPKSRWQSGMMLSKRTVGV